MDAYRVLDSTDATGSRGKLCVQIMNGPLAVAAQREAVSHVTSAILPEVEGMFPLVRVFGVSAIIVNAFLQSRTKSLTRALPSPPERVGRRSDEQSLCRCR